MDSTAITSSPIGLQVLKCGQKIGPDGESNLITHAFIYLNLHHSKLINFLFEFFYKKNNMVIELGFKVGGKVDLTGLLKMWLLQSHTSSQMEALFRTIIW